MIIENNSNHVVKNDLNFALSFPAVFNPTRGNSGAKCSPETNRDDITVHLILPSSI